MYTEWLVDNVTRRCPVSMLAIVDEKSRTAEHGHGVDHCRATVEVHHNEPSLSGRHCGTDGRLCVTRRRRRRTQVGETCWRRRRAALTTTLWSWWRRRRWYVVADRRTAAVSLCQLMNGTCAVSTALLLFLLERVATVFGASVLKPHLLSQIQLAKLQVYAKIYRCTRTTCKPR